MNTWVHDGSKDITVNRLMYRELLKDSLDQIFEHRYDMMKDCVESKVFGIGLESYTVGSNDFYTSYAAKNDMMITLDTGHFHPTESVADKVSAMLLFVPELMLHVSRPIRWDSDHVTIMDDPTLDLFSEIVRAGALNRVHYGLDYFDGTLNRIGAYVIGSRASPEVHAPRPSRAHRQAPPVRARRPALPAPRPPRGVQEPALERRLRHVLPAQQRSRWRDIHPRNREIRGRGYI